MDIRERVELGELTTFKIGGMARYFADVRTEADVREATDWARQHKLPLIVLAGGSNVLIPDDGLEALVIHITEGTWSIADGMLTADFGCDLLGLIRNATREGFGGWEKLAGIPGTIGGAVRGNAGAFGSEIKDFVRFVRAFDRGTGDVREFANAECDFAYRHSYFKDHPEWIITRVVLQLRRIQFDISNSEIENTIMERERRHLQNVRAAGSFFMNPKAPQDIVAMFEQEKHVKSREGRVPAGWLIEKAGMKGATVGGAIASLQHPNYIVNQGSATAEDVKQLAQQVKDAVRTQFGVELHEEAAVL